MQSVVRSHSGWPLCESYAATIAASCLATSGYLVNSATAAAAKWVIEHAGGGVANRFYIRMPVSARLASPLGWEGKNSGIHRPSRASAVAASHRVRMGCWHPAAC